ncbi:MAG: glycosyltransferase family 4 protein [Muribaculaceae bacterium]|nr:glycosyltransferase family 4 protein [Muribaculaceae bacterium]
MKLLMLNAYYSPEIFSSSYLIENRLQAFANAGIVVEMLVPTPTRGITDTARKEFSAQKVIYEHNRMLKIMRFPLFKEYKSPYLKGIRYLLVSLNHLIRGLTKKNINCIFCTTTPPTTGIAAVLLKIIKRTKLVYNVQDVFPDSLVAAGLTSKKSILWRIGRCLENFIYRNADKIIVISQDFRKNLLEKGVPDEKIEVIYNWVDQNIVKPINKADNKLYDEFKISRDKFTVVYAGNMGLAQNIQIIVDAAERLKHLDIQFLLFGKGTLVDDIRRQVEVKSLSNIRFLPFQPYEKVASVYSLGDLGIVSCKKGFGKSAMPSKTWSIMASGTAVVASFDSGELKDIIEFYECGSFADADNVEALTHTIEKYYNNRGLCSMHGHNGLRVVTENFSREIGTKLYVDVIRNLGV